MASIIEIAGVFVFAAAVPALSPGAPLSAAPPPAVNAPASTGDLVILASAEDALALIDQLRIRRLTDMRGMLTIRSEECARLRPGLYVAAKPAAVGAAATTLATARKRSPDAYLRKCIFAPGGLAARRIPIVDPSFAQMSARPVNWSPDDVVTRVESGLLLRPWFDPVSDDPREGLRLAVELVPGNGSPRRVVEKDCPGAEVAVGKQYLAVACANEQVLEQLVYRTVLYRVETLFRARVIERCRRPSFSASGQARCLKQTIGSNGTISEKLIEVPLA
jgi:hypothetical protein